MRLSRAIAVFVALVPIAPALADSCPAVTSDEAGAQVRAAFDSWDAAVTHKDLEKTMAIFSQSLHFQVQGSPDFGYARLRRNYASSFARENAPTWHPIVENMISSPDMVTLFSEWQLIPFGGGAPIKEYRGVDVFQRESDCVWRVTASLNYADAATAALSPSPNDRAPGPAEVRAGSSHTRVASRDSRRAARGQGQR